MLLYLELYRRTFITFRPSTTNPALRLSTKTLLILIRLPSRGTTASELVKREEIVERP